MCLKKKYTIFKIGMKFTLSQFKKFNQCYSAYELIIQELCELHICTFKANTFYI